MISKLTVEEALEVMPIRTPAFLVKTGKTERMVSETQLRYLMVQVAKKIIDPFQYFTSEKDCLSGWATNDDDGGLPYYPIDMNNLESENSMGICTEYKFELVRIKSYKTKPKK